MTSSEVHYCCKCKKLYVVCVCGVCQLREAEIKLSRVENKLRKFLSLERTSGDRKYQITLDTRLGVVAAATMERNDIETRLASRQHRQPVLYPAVSLSSYQPQAQPPPQPQAQATRKRKASDSIENPPLVTVRMKLQKNRVYWTRKYKYTLTKQVIITWLLTLCVYGSAKARTKP
jgi:hypothetical protein